MGEEKKFLNEISERVDSLIDKICEKRGFDRAFFAFRLTCEILGEGFEKIEEVELIRDRKPSYCVFCGRETYYIEGDRPLCVKCYAEIRKEEEK